MDDKELPKQQPEIEKKIEPHDDISKIRNWDIIDTNSTAIIKKSKDIDSSARQENKSKDNES